MILSETEIINTDSWWLPAIRNSGFIIYWLAIFLFLSGFISLFIIHVDISVRAKGIIRPTDERTVIKSPKSGIIDTIYYKDGERVIKNSLLLKLRDQVLPENLRLNDTEISQCRKFILDLELLTAADLISSERISLLKTPIYKQEALRFFSRSDEHRIMLLKANHELMLNEKLAADRVISPKELYDIRVQQQKTFSAFESFRHQQFVDWQADLVKYKAELQQCYSRQEELEKVNETNQIRAPVSGNLQELNGHYAGNSIEAGEMICTLSPDGQLIGECYVSSKDIGLLKTGQLVRFQVDAFNYNYFGSGTGNICSIDNDYILVDKTPVFKVKCTLNERGLKLFNGYTGELKKGMGFQARFAICNRSLWQLLYDGLDDWLNPGAQPALKNYSPDEEIHSG
jgi:multidrug resistance efflux pump